MVSHSGPVPEGPFLRASHTENDTHITEKHCDAEPDRINARISALAKLTDPNQGNDPQHRDASSDSWRSLLPPGDAGRNRDSHDDTQSSLQSWRSFLNMNSPCSDGGDSHDMYLGPSDDPSGVPTDDVEDDEYQGLLFGRRADLFVRRSSITAVTISNAKQRLPNAQQLETASKNAGQRPQVHAFKSSPSVDVYVHPMRPRSITGVSAFDHADSRQEAVLGPRSGSTQGPNTLYLSSDTAEEERENWPTSSRRDPSPLMSPQRSEVSLDTSEYTSPRTEPDQGIVQSEQEVGRAGSVGPLSTGEALTTSTIPTARSALSEPKPERSLCEALCANLPKIDTGLKRCQSPQQQDTNQSHAMDRQIRHDTRVSMVTTEQQYTLSLHVPGFSLDGITLATKGFNRRTLHIIASRWGNDKSDHFERRITFGSDAIMTAIRARFDGEHLNVEIPRKTLRQPRTRVSQPLSAFPHHPPHSAFLTSR